MTAEQRQRNRVLQYTQVGGLAFSASKDFPCKNAEPATTVYTHRHLFAFRHLSVFVRSVFLLDKVSFVVQKHPSQ